MTRLLPILLMLTGCVAPGALSTAELRRPLEKDVMPTPPPPPGFEVVRDAEGRRLPASPELIKALSDPALAARAATAMARIQSKAYLPSLLEAVEPGRPAVATAIWAIGQVSLGYDWRPADVAGVIDPVLRRSGDPEIAIRVSVAETLGKLGGERAVEALIAMLKDKAPVVRAAAVDGLWRSFYLHKKPRPDLAPLIALAGDSDEEVRWRLSYALMRIGGAEETLALLAKDSNRWSRLFAVRGLKGRLGIDDPDPLVRLEAEKWTTKAPPVPAFEELRKAAKGTDRKAALAAIESLGALDDSASVALLEELLDHGDVAVEWMAIESLKRRKAGKAALERRATGKPSMAFEPLIDALEALGSKETLARFSNDPGWASYARRAYFRLAGEEAPGPPPAASTESRFRHPFMAGKVLLELKHEKGTMKLLLDADAAPENVAAVVALAKRGYYDGLDWHRLDPNFVIQGGDPRGDGWGDPGWRLPDEISRLPHLRGTVGISKFRNDTGDSQLYITHIPTPHLDGRYTVIGYVIEGLDVLDRIERGDRILSAKVGE